MSRRLLCIGLGVDDYVDPWLARLSFAALDVRNLQTALASGVASPDHLLPLQAETDAVQAVALIRRFLREQNVRQGDDVLFCFAGHGMLVPDAAQVERQYLLLRQADSRSLVDGHLAGNDVLAVHSLLALFDEFPASFALLIDACRLPAQRLDGSPLAGQTRDAIRVGLVGRAMQGLRPAVPRRYLTGSAGHGAPVVESEPEGSASGLRHLLVYSSQEFDQAHEVSSLGGGLFLSTFTAWLLEKQRADELAVIDQDWVAVMADRMNAAARSVQVTIAQRPWISHPDRVFALHRPADRAASPAMLRPAAAPGLSSAPLPLPPGAVASKLLPPTAPVDPGVTPWFRLQYVADPWCPTFIHLPPALTGLSHGVAIMEDPVTWSQWWATLGQRPAAMPAATRRNPNDSMPVTWVSRTECEDFALRLTDRLAGLHQQGGLQPLRLMSDQEWTLVCACGPGARLGRSDFGVKVTAAVFRWSSQGYARNNNPAAPQSVSHEHNRHNVWGVRGMQGNVRELAWHHEQASEARAMGGGFRSEVAELRPDHSIRFSSPCEDVGFRLICLLQPGESSLLFSGSHQT